MTNLSTIVQTLNKDLKNHNHNNDKHSSLIWKGMTINNKTRRAYCCDNELNLSPTEYKILELLINNPEQVFSREEIISSVWKKGSSTGLRSVDVHIRRLRKAIESKNNCSLMIRTSRSFGYSIDSYKHFQS